MSITIVCSECNAKFKGRDEYEAEVKWNAHKCPALPDLSKLSLDELRALIDERAKKKNGGKK